MTYLLQITVYTAILFAIYLLLLKDRVAHIWNRAYLLLCAALPMVIPLISIPSIQRASPVISRSAGILLLQVSGITTGSKRISEVVNWSYVVTIIYVMVSLVILAWTLFHIIRFLKLVTRGNYEKNGGVKVVRETNAGPGSFLNIIFFPGKNIDAVIYEHEQAHIRLKHSFDLIFIRCMLIVFWPNIMLYMLIKELKMVHEFQADALAAGNKISYINTLLNNSFHTHRFSMANTFFHHPVKRRIRMMNKSVLSSKGLFFLAARSFIVTTVLVAAMVYLQSCKQPVQAIPDETIFQFNFRTDTAIIKVTEDRTDLPKPIVLPISELKSDWSLNAQFNDRPEFVIVPDAVPGSFTIMGSTGALKNENLTVQVTDLNGKTIFERTVTTPAGYLNEKVILNNLRSFTPYTVDVYSSSFNEKLLLIAK